MASYREVVSGLSKILKQKAQTLHKQCEGEIGWELEPWLKFVRNNTNNAVDNIYGIRYEDGRYVMGSRPVEVKSNDIIIDGNVYNGSPDLYDLIFVRKPIRTSLDEYNQKVLETYRDMLIHTQSYKNPKTGTIKGSSGSKYKNIIKPLLVGIQYEKTKLYGAPPAKKRKIFGGSISHENVMQEADNKGIPSLTLEDSTLQHLSKEQLPTPSMLDGLSQTITDDTSSLQNLSKEQLPTPSMLDRSSQTETDDTTLHISACSKRIPKEIWQKVEGYVYRELVNLPATQLNLKTWDDLGKLVYRLRLLMGARRGGTSQHTEEIIAILEELKRVSIIKDFDKFNW